MSNGNPTHADGTGEIADRLAAVMTRIDGAARRAGRDPAEVTLLGASKVQGPERLAAAVEAGLGCLGENYVQEARDKQPEVERLLEPEVGAQVRWHMIGPLQRNKARDAVRLFDVIETLDRESLAKELDKRAAAVGRTIEALVQVNLSGEPQKAGVPEEGLPGLLEACSQLEHLRVIGLMTIPAPSPEPDGNRAVFARLRNLRDTLRLQPHGEDLRELSMGMSRDFETAIEEGATFVRVGTDLFGPRPAKD
jgi:pyridoxal phosphate enzyme (YggS family)